MKKTIFIAMLISLIGSVFAASSVERTVKGVGKTRQQAVKNALYEAVGQVQGVTVTSGVATSAAAVGSIDVTREEVDKSIEMESISVRGQSDISLVQAEGLVKSYEVIEEKQADDGTWQVTVKVQVYDYESPVASNKSTLAVWAFEIPVQPCMFGDVRVAPNEVHRQFVQRMTTLLRDSGRFNLLDRTHDQAFREERNIMKSDDTGTAQKAWLKNVEGADYLVTGRIRRFEITTEVKPLPTTGIRSEEFRGYFVAELQLLVPATRQVAYSHEYRMKLKHPEIKALAEDWRRDERDFDQIKDTFMDLAAHQVVEDVLNDLSPVRVAVAGADGLILDQGGSRMKPGCLYEVFAAGQTIRDPQTKELLGKAENKVATLRVTRVLPKFSYAEFVDGFTDKLKAGQVCRLHPASKIFKAQEPEGGMKSRIERTGSGGVRLPFD